MWHCGKPALCIEFSSTRQTQLGMKCIQIFLTYFGCTSGKEKLKVYSQTHSSITQELRTQSNSFKFVKKIKTLSRVPNNTPIAYDGALKYVTDRNTVIFFPSQPKKKGDYACIIGEIIKK
jgi:hypothetical protein